MNHELDAATLSEPSSATAQEPRRVSCRSDRRRDGDVLAGERAYDRVYNENTLVGPGGRRGNATRGVLALLLRLPRRARATASTATSTSRTRRSGRAANTFDGKGGLAVAIFDNELHTLPKLGRFAWENTLVQPNHGTRTVIMAMEDGPARPAREQPALHVRRQEGPSAGAGVLERNGLDNGKLYVFARRPGTEQRGDFATGTIDVEWVADPERRRPRRAQLEAASDAASAMPLRPARGRRLQPATSRTSTSSSPPARAARRRRQRARPALLARLHPGNPLKPATLTVVYNADHGGRGAAATSRSAPTTSTSATTT